MALKKATHVLRYNQTLEEDWATPLTAAALQDIDDEMERWGKLLERPLSLEENPLRYGELTLYGYYVARDTLKVSPAFWPTDPVAIAKLLTICKIDAFELDGAFDRHVDLFANDPDKYAVAMALRVHVELLKLHGIARTPDRLLPVLAYFEWSRIKQRESFAAAFQVMAQYLQSPADEASFLAAWLPDLTSGRDFYGSDCLGVSLAKSFLGPDVSALKKWCIDNDDQQGLAYLVWQKRVDFREWLREVAFPSRPAASRDRYSKHADLARRTEQTECLGRLYEKMFLDREYQELLAECPTLLENLVGLSMDEPDSTHSITWMGHLLAMQALTMDDPLFTRWLDAALLSQETMLKNFSSGSRLTSTILSTYDVWRDLFSAAGEKCKTLIGRHMVMHLRVNAADPVPAEAVGDLTWLRGASFAPALRSMFQDKVDRNQKLAKLCGVYPYLDADEAAIVGAAIVNNVITGEFPSDNVFKGLGIKSPAESATTALGDGWFLMNAMTGVAVESPDGMLSALDISAKDPFYASTLRDWVDAAFNVKSAALALPKLDLSGLIS